jgi:hypothetical protein
MDCPIRRWPSAWRKAILIRSHYCEKYNESPGLLSVPGVRNPAPCFLSAKAFEHGDGHALDHSLMTYLSLLPGAVSIHFFI